MVIALTNNLIVRYVNASDRTSHNSSCMKYYYYYLLLLLLLLIIITTLFQEDNIFGMYASLTYGPQLQRYACHWQLNRHKLFTVSCTEQVRSPYTEHAASGLPNPTPLEGEVRFVRAQDQQVVTTRSPRIITECLLTLLMLIKIYVHAIYSWLCIGTILSKAAFSQGKFLCHILHTLQSFLSDFCGIITVNLLLKNRHIRKMNPQQLQIRHKRLQAVQSLAKKIWSCTWILRESMNMNVSLQ